MPARRFSLKLDVDATQCGEPLSESCSPLQRYCYVCQGRNARLRKFGLTPDAWNELWEAQQGKCAICGEAMLPSGNAVDSVNIDHDHNVEWYLFEPGDQRLSIRGLVHWRCNKAIDRVDQGKRKPTEAEAAYLARYRAYLKTLLPTERIAA